MRSIREVAEQELVWKQRHLTRREYELSAGDTVVARMEWQKLLGTLVRVETAEATWTFKRVGFWRPRVTARIADADDDLATFEPSWTGKGTLSLPGGVVYQWESTNFWHSQWAWQDAQGKPLVRFANRHGLKMESQVVVETTAHDLPEAPLLIALGWYLIVLMALDAASSGTTGAIVASTSVASS